MTEPDSLPLISEADCAPVPVFNCQIILGPDEAGQKIVGRVANLKGIQVTAATERDVLTQITRLFRAQISALHEAGTPIPWVEPAEQPGPEESLRFVPIHL